MGSMEGTRRTTSTKPPDLAGWLCVVLLGLMVVATFLQVLCRYVFNYSLSWSEELALYAFIWLTLLGAALVTRNETHIAVDSIAKVLPSKTQETITILFGLVQMVLLIVMLYSGLQLAAENMMQKAASLPVPVACSYLAGPAGALLMIIYMGRSLYRKHGNLLSASLFLAALLEISWLAITGSLATAGVNKLAILLGSLAVFLFLGMPIAFSIGASSLIYLLVRGNIPLLLVPQRIVYGINSFSLLAVPFFILAGALMNYGGITRRLINFCGAFVGHITGGLSQVVVLTNMIMAGISGSAVADAAATGAILIPSMIEKGYDRKYAAAITASAAIAGPIIPPSIPMVILGVATGVSIGRLFLGGAAPGIMLGFGLMVASYFISKKRNYPREVRASWGERVKYTKGAFLALIMPLIILGGILGGIFTPTEAAVIATVYALIVGVVIYREIRIADLPKILREAAEDTARVMLVLGMAALMGWILAEEQMPQLIVDAMYSITQNPLVMLLIINIALLIIGCFFEVTSALILLAPLLMPLVLKMEIDPVHFGVVMILNLMIGLLTPPVGLCLYVSGSIAKVTLADISKAAIPFILILIGVLFVITYVPDIVLFLPNLLMGR